VAFALLRVARLGLHDAARAAVLLSTIGEFSFVIIPLSAQFGLISQGNASILAAIAALTMFVGPLAAKGLEALLARHAARKPDESYDEDFREAEGEVLVIGFGRFGQLVNQMLLSAERDVTVIDRDIDQVKAAGSFGFKVYYGDGRRLDVLRAAGAERAGIIAVCIDDKEAASAIAEMVLRSFPQAKLLVRAFDRIHALDLMDRGVRAPVREVFESALYFGREALVAVGVSEDQAEAIREDVRRRDMQRLQRQRNEGIFGGHELLRGVAVKPTPLSEPKRKGREIKPVTGAPAAADDLEGVTGASS
jgi:voltage-gated potassium channel Kch